MFNIYHKFKLQVMPVKDVDELMTWVKTLQPFWTNATFLLSVGTWLVNEYQRYDLAKPVLTYALDIFPDEEVNQTCSVFLRFNRPERFTLQ